MVVFCRATIDPTPEGWREWMACFGVEEKTLDVWLPINLHPNGVNGGMLRAGWDGEPVFSSEGLYLVRGQWLLAEVPNKDREALQQTMVKMREGYLIGEDEQ